MFRGNRRSVHRPRLGLLLMMLVEVAPVVEADIEAKDNLADITMLIGQVYISKTETAVCE